jgi:protein-S-isoprenylcysteine O-methyltransferase Ste14
VIDPMNGNARASVVNRTHRVVREQALTMRATQERSRSLWVPLAIVSVLLPLICYAAWAVLDEYDLTPNGIPDASDQLMVMLLWLLPVTALAVGSVWFRRSRGNQEVSR